MVLEKTITLLNLCGKEELALLDREINASKSKRQRSLHKFATGKKLKPEKDYKVALFKVMFGAMYSEKKDELLRNEIRLYNEGIKEVLAWSLVKRDKSLRRDLYLKSLDAKNDKDLFISEVRLEIKNDTAAQDYNKLSQHLASLTQATLASQQYNVKSFNIIRKQIFEEIDALHYYWNDAISEAFVKLAYVERVLIHLSQDISLSDFSTLKKGSLGQESYLAKYNYLKAKSYNIQADKRIELLQKIIALLLKVDHPKISKDKNLALNYAALALEYLLNTKYEKAVENFEKCKELKAELTDQQWRNISLNYLSSLCKLGDFVKAKDFIISQSDLLENEEWNSRILPNVIGVYILNEEIERAERLLPNNLKEGEFDTYHYMRILQAMIHYENDLLELSEIELINLRKHLNSLDKANYEFTIEVCQLVLSFVSAKYSSLPEDFEKKKKAIAIDIDKLRKKHGAFQTDGIIISWLRKRMN